MKSEKNPSRRKILKAIGTSSGVGVIGANPVGAAKEESKFIGYSYDSVTHMIQRPGTLKLKRHKQGITGRLNIAGYPSIEIGNGDEPLEPRNSGYTPTYGIYLDEPQYTNKDGKLLQLKFIDSGYSITGEATYGSPEYSTIGFTLLSEKSENPKRRVKKSLINNGEGKKPENMGHTPDVPSEGVPRNTSIAAISEEMN